MVLISLEKKSHEPFLNFGVSSLEQHLVDRDEENDRSGSSLALVLPEVSGQAREQGDISYSQPQSRGDIHVIYRFLKQ